MYIVGDDRVPISGASIEVRVEATGSLATIYADKDGAALANPFTSDSNGLARFYAAAGFYKITATSGAYSATFRFVPIGQAMGYDVGTASGNVPTIALADVRYNANLNHNLAATSAPTVNDDESAGYEIQSVWVDVSVSPDQRYICLDNTEGAAVWVEVYSTVGGTSADLITADSSTAPLHPTGTSAYWDFTNVQEFIEQLINGPAYNGGVAPSFSWPPILRQGIQAGQYSQYIGGKATIGDSNTEFVEIDATLQSYTYANGSDGGQIYMNSAVLYFTHQLVDWLTVNASGIPAFGAPVGLKSYTVVGLPAAASYTGHMVYVSNESGGAVPAFSDGTNWRRVTDRAIVS